MTSEGDVWLYPYLWAREGERGETEGRKTRPCVITVKIVTRRMEHRAFLLAVTSKPPASGSASIEVPEIERRRAGLSPDIRQWIVLDEVNVDTIERSYYFEPDARIGAVSPRFLRKIKEAMSRRLREGALTQQSRE